MKSTATTVEGYLASLPPDRRAALEAVRRVILDNLDGEYAEGIQYGMIGYHVPHSVYPPGYHCDPKQPLPFASIASQKNHMAVYLMCLYGSPEEEARFRAEWAESGKRLDMGKSCIRFRRLEDLALDVLGRAVARVPAREFIAHYEKALRTPPEGRKPAAGKAARKRPAARKPARKAAKKRP